jgi:hypothetical protein
MTWRTRKEREDEGGHTLDYPPTQIVVHRMVRLALSMCLREVASQHPAIGSHPTRLPILLCSTSALSLYRLPAVLDGPNESRQLHVRPRASEGTGQ